MPCFKGLAVSIHSDGPLKEIGIQKQARQSRISSYIAVPPAKLSKDSNSTKLEQPSFAISITLLTPGLNVPYSAPEATPEDPFPRSRIVGGLPGSTSERGRYDSVIPPYVPQTTSPNETIAAYIYFDGRDSGFRIHGTNTPKSIGWAASSGCFRMLNQDVIDLYDRVPMGAKVVVL